MYSSINGARKIGYLRENIEVDSGFTSCIGISKTYIKSLNIKSKILKCLKKFKITSLYQSWKGVRHKTHNNEKH